MAEISVILPPGVGLHARPAALFVGAAAKSACDVTIGRPGEPGVNAKSILGVMGLGAKAGEEMVVVAEGDGSDELLASLKEILETPEGGHA
ncbi:MAG: HPr family phosphocarrier protein [Candidatus Nanopelagicales bacterium]